MEIQFVDTYQIHHNLKIKTNVLLKNWHCTGTEQKELAHKRSDWFLCRCCLTLKLFVYYLILI